MYSGKQVVAGEADEWQPVNEILEGGREDVGVVSLSPGTEIKNGSVESFDDKVFHVGAIDEVRGKYLLFHPDIVDDVPEVMGSHTLGPGDRNDASFYVGRFSGVPRFEFKWDEDYGLEHETPHVHNSWEVYTFVGGEGVLAVAGEDYDFTETRTDSWDWRGDIRYLGLEDGDPVHVPPGVPHRVEEQERNPDHVITRYGDDEVAKYDLKGEPVYPEDMGGDIDLRTYPEALE
ncbi:MAG: hypothetical protein ABEJ75_02970 [Candidatus Nanohaloarchaea archaeon]